MKSFRSLSAAQRLNLIVLFLAGLLFWSSLAAMLPVLPLYVEDTGADSAAIGIVMGSFAIGLLATRSWLARLADQRGRKLVMMIGMAAVAIAPLAYLLTTSIPVLIGIRAFHGLSIAAFALAFSALVVDLSPPQYRGELIGYMSLVNPIGMAAGPAIGGLLHGWMGYLPAFLASAVLGGLGMLCIVPVSESDNAETSGNAPECANLERANLNVATAANAANPAAPIPVESNQFWRLLNSPRIRIPALVLLLIGLAFGTLVTFVPLFIEETQIELNVGLFYTAAAIASFSVRLVTGRASDYYGRGPFITVSLLLYAAAMLLLWQAQSASALLIAAVFEGLGAGILIPMMAALMADRSYPNERGRTFSLCMVGFDVGIALAGPMLGAIATYTGYRTIFGLCAGLAFLGFLVFLTLSNKSVGYSLKFALGRGADVYAIDAPYFKRRI